MTIKTLFQQNGKIEPGFVDVKLLPGIPQLHIVGLPDASIRECGIKLKSAMRSLGLEWPTGQQIVVSLRPMDFRKGGSGAELAIALAYLAVTGQLSEPMREALPGLIVYGEVTLGGEVFAPADLAQVMQAATSPVLTGTLQSPVREGRWLEIKTLHQLVPERKHQIFDWPAYWRRPAVPKLELHESAARHLMLALHMKLNVLLAGPQGSGKTTWARLLHSLSDPPDSLRLVESAQYFGDEIFESAWRPLEQPHHTITPQAMIGGGLPLEPGVITRAHGGVLIMDEFLHFHPQVLEALREPIESGFIDLARKGTREKFPADFQLIATTNLCPCGKLNPAAIKKEDCNYNLIRCKSTTMRLSGPLLDRFDLLSLTHEWLKRGEKVSLPEVVDRVAEARDFARSRTEEPEELPEWTEDFALSHRRRRSMARVARGLADLEGSEKIYGRHTQEAFALVVTPMHKLREIFA